MQSKMDSLSDEDKADRSKTFKALAEAVVEHITGAAIVTVPSVGLISATAGAPVTGVASGTIS